MKKGVSVLIISLSIVFLIINLSIVITAITGETITGESITGDVSHGMGIEISIIGPPVLTLINPENKTYLTNESLLLNYTASVDTEEIWYNIDNGGNTTITSFIYFNTTAGMHILYLYANNSINASTTSANFTANLTLFTIIYNEYKGGNKGDSENFNQYAYRDIQNLSNITLHHASFGRIQFNELINLTDDANLGDNQIDLDSNTNISNNRIELNATALPNFNVSATLWFYNLTFTNPRILKDGEVCPSTICTEISYSGGTLEFNVTEFSVYYASEETPGDEVAEETPSTVRGSSARTDFWTGKTYVITEKEFENGVTRQLSIRDRFKVEIEGDFYYVGVISLTETTTTMDISGRPQEAILAIGDIRRFGLTGDDFYDIQIILGGIENNKGELTIKRISEKITPEKEAEEEEKEREAREKEEIETARKEEIRLLGFLIGILISVILIVIIVLVLIKRRKGFSKKRTW